MELESFDEVDAVEIVESPATGVALGWGWNRGDSEPIPTICVEFVAGEEPAQTRYMTMSEVSDSYTMMKSLGVSAEASVKAIGYQASGKAAFAKSTNLNSQSSTFIMNAVVQNGVRYAAPVPDSEDKGSDYQPPVTERGGTRGAIRLTPKALQLATRRDGLDAFKRHCGSAFVSAIYGGAKLTAAISFVSKSLEEKSSLSAEMSGSGWGARFKAKVKGGETSANSSNRMDISIFMTGGKGDAIPASQDDLLNKLETISLDAYDAPKDFQIAITPYEIVSNWPGKLLPDKESEFEELASYWGSYNTLYDEIQQILDNPHDYYTVSIDGDGCPVVPQCTAETKAYDTSVATLNHMRQNLEAIKGWAAQIATIEKPLILARDEANAALKRCQEKHNLTSTEQAANNLSSLKRAQDEVLVALRQMQEEARECSDRSDKCSFNVNRYRSPYAFRIQLPVPVSASLTSVEEIVDYLVGRPAKHRCEFSPSDPGCLTNGEIDQWQSRLGFSSVNRSVQPDAFAKYAQITDLKKEKAGDADSAAVSECTTSHSRYEEGRTDVIWYSASHQKPEDGMRTNQMSRTKI
ncbi:MAG: hypothetical protein K1562_12140 [Candidatus Thiodiazotropha sp. (ex. Lucinisca nassula)]|nr:hypothetical protein [Candidatus Thiodiazotropha sp. (ex. Lucinisca nassula)]